MTILKVKRILLIAIILTSLIVIVMIAPTRVIRPIRINKELNRIQLEISLRDVTIIDYRGHLTGIYAKMELPAELYEKVKERWYSADCALYYNDFAKGNMRNNHYKYERFLNQLELMDRVKRMNGYHSMNFDDFEEILFIADILYGAWFTTGGTDYSFVKEKSGSIYLYVYSCI